MSTKKKLIVAVACLLVATCSLVTGTLAWLTTKTESVVNTFTTSDINITLTETDTALDADSNVNTNSYKMVPGDTITKDPEVTVLANSEACYLFVKIEKSTNFDTYMTYAMADGWIALTGVDGVYYRQVTASDADQPFVVLKDNQVTVLGTVTKENMNAIDGIDENGATGTDAANAEIAARPTLTFTAYAVQQLGFADAAAAWVEAAKLDTTNP